MSVERWQDTGRSPTWQTRRLSVPTMSRVLAGDARVGRKNGCWLLSSVAAVGQAQPQQCARVPQPTQRGAPARQLLVGLDMTCAFRSRHWLGSSSSRYGAPTVSPVRHLGPVGCPTGPLSQLHRLRSQRRWSANQVTVQHQNQPGRRSGYRAAHGKRATQPKFDAYSTWAIASRPSGNQ